MRIVHAAIIPSTVINTQKSTAVCGHSVQPAYLYKSHIVSTISTARSSGDSRGIQVTISKSYYLIIQRGTYYRVACLETRRRSDDTLRISEA